MCVCVHACVYACGGLTVQCYGPNMGVMCLRDGEESANLQLIWQIDGYTVLPEGAQNSCSYFEAALSNRYLLRDDVDMALSDLFIGTNTQLFFRHTFFQTELDVLPRRRSRTVQCAGHTMPAMRNTTRLRVQAGFGH